MPQAKKAYFDSTKGVSLNTYIGLFSIAVLWIPHGIFTRQPLLTYSNVISLFFSLIIIYAISRDNNNYKIMLYAFVAMFGSLSIYLLGSLTIRVSILMFLTLFLRIPQMYKALFAKNIEGISIFTWIIAGFGNSMWLGAGIIKKDLGLIIPTSFNVAFSIIIVLVVLLRQKSLTVLVE
ncbi:MAG: hypothetical protein KBF89_04515 [Acidimicrobiia bacterium]|nr:hypothetical protein [Acidimicrobiia bacterium]